MSLLGIDVGTSGCKAAAFSLDGRLLAAAYAEYDILRPEPGWAELDPESIWAQVKETIRQVTAAVPNEDPIQALAVSSLGEAVVPIGADRRPLAAALLNFDPRGEAYVPALADQFPDDTLYPLNGNTFGNQYTLTKLAWIRDHQPDLYRRTQVFLHWSGYIAMRLGADAAVDYSLANRTLLFDLDRQDWSDTLLQRAGLEREKLPRPVASGTLIGRVSAEVADELGLPAGTLIAAGAHDQCANAVGCGVIAEGQAVYGMGTYHCITPVFAERREPGLMIARGLNTEHHAVPGKYVCFIYNQGGSLVKWYRDTFAAAERRRAQESGEDIYAALFAEIPAKPSSILVLPHFAPTGPPAFIADSCGVMAGLKLETTRGEILKGIVESVAFYLKECVDALPPTGIHIRDFRAVGGGSKADAWVQVCADIFNRPFVRPCVTEAGALGAAIIAGVGSQVWTTYADGVQAMLRIERTFEPDPRQVSRYAARYEQYRQLAPLLGDYLRTLAA